MKMKRFAAGVVASVLIAGAGVVGTVPAQAAGSVPEVQRTLQWVGGFKTKALCKYNVADTVMNSWQLVKPCEWHNDGKWWFKAYM